MTRIQTWTTTLSLLVAVTLAMVNTGHATEPPALTEMNGKVLAQLQADFNRESTKTRIILLLSPT